MRKINVRLLAAALALGLFFGAAFAEEDDPVVVRVGDFTYGRSQVQSALDAEINLIEIVGGTWMTEEEKIEQRDSVIDRYIGVGLIQARLKEKGRKPPKDRR